MSLTDLLVLFVAAAYVLSTMGYAANFRRKGDLRGRIAFWALVCGWMVHTLLLVSITVTTGRVPLSSSIVPSVCAWLVVIVYVYLGLTTRDRCLGALVVPIVTLLHLLGAGNLMALEGVRQPATTAGWFQLHVLAYILAYAGFAISCVGATMYVMLLGEIQKKHLGFFYERLPSLETLDQVNCRAATFGFVFLTAGVISSTALAHQELYRLWAVWSKPTVAPLLAAWVIYAGQFVARWAAGWRGKRSAVMSIAGFALVVLAFPVVGVLFSGKHPLAK